MSSGFWETEEIPEDIEQRLEERRESAQETNNTETEIAADYLLSNWEQVGDEVYHGTHITSAKEMLEDGEITPGARNKSATGETSTCDKAFGTTLIPAARHYAKKARPKSVEEEYKIARKRFDNGENLPEVDNYGDMERARLARFIDEYVDWYKDLESEQKDMDVRIYDPNEEQEKTELQRLKEEGRERGFEQNPDIDILYSVKKLREKTNGFEHLPERRHGHPAVQTIIGFDREAMENDKRRVGKADIMWRDEFDAIKYQGEEKCTPISEIRAERIDLTEATLYVEGTAFFDEDFNFDEEAVRSEFGDIDIAPIEALEMKHEEFMRDTYEDKGMVYDYGTVSGYRLRLDPVVEEWDDRPERIHVSG